MYAKALRLNTRLLEICYKIDDMLYKIGKTIL